jgi:hypothetical protein
MIVEVGNLYSFHFRLSTGDYIKDYKNHIY